MADSEPLSTLMAGGVLPVDEAVRIARDTADALAKSGVHGELWPSAISVGPAGVGVLPPGGADRMRYGQYAAPERILGKEATPASDVFSIGAILFHAVAGRPPFRGDSPAQMMLAICSEPPRELPSNVPGDVAAIVHRCLMRDPVARYASPAVLRDALDALAPSAHDAFPGRRILLADDEPDIRDAYARMASRIGVACDVVGTGREAIDSLKARSYDLAILDLNMPRLSGWEVLDFLRPRAQSRPRRLYIITGFADQRISEADRDLVHGVIYKPVVPDELRTLLTECLRGADVSLAAIFRQTKHAVA